jgi:hypothetical protein
MGGWVEDVMMLLNGRSEVANAGGSRKFIKPEKRFSNGLNNRWIVYCEVAQVPLFYPDVSLISYKHSQKRGDTLPYWAS